MRSRCAPVLRRGAPWAAFGAVSGVREGTVWGVREGAGDGDRGRGRGALRGEGCEGEINRIRFSDRAVAYTSEARRAKFVQGV